MRAAIGVSVAIGMDPNRRLMPWAASVAAWNAPEIEANDIACSAIRRRQELRIAALIPCVAAPINSFSGM